MAGQPVGENVSVVAAEGVIWQTILGASGAGAVTFLMVLKTQKESVRVHKKIRQAHVGVKLFQLVL